MEDEIHFLSETEGSDMLLQEVAAETEVTTSYIIKANGKREAKNIEDQSSSSTGIVDVDSRDGIPFEGIKEHADYNNADVSLGNFSLIIPDQQSVTLNISEDPSLIPLGSENALEEPNKQKKVIPTTAKREKDKIKKRMLRANPAFRELERLKAKERMKAKRDDLNYRESERNRDRLRRKVSRKQNIELRKKEMERDRRYKKLHRFSNGKSLDNCGVLAESDCVSVKVEMPEHNSDSDSSRHRLSYSGEITDDSLDNISFPYQVIAVNEVEVSTVNVNIMTTCTEVDNTDNGKLHIITESPD